jgi:hypothetical protein
MRGKSELRGRGEEGEEERRERCHEQAGCSAPPLMVVASNEVWLAGSFGRA